MTAHFTKLPAIVIQPDQLFKVVQKEFYTLDNYLKRHDIRYIHLWWYLKGEGGEANLEEANRLLNEMLNAFSEKTGILISFRHAEESGIDDPFYVLEFDDMHEMIMKAYPLQEQGITFQVKMLPVRD